MAETILRHTPNSRIVATSREPLRADGETVVRLEGLDYPDADVGGGAESALAYPAVQLLVERIQASQQDFSLTDDLAPAAAEICRRLDGIALAIQLAASRVPAYGLGGVAARLDDRFGLLSHGNRTGLARHQTLQAAVSWSFELLDAAERTVCMRLAIFSGAFSLDAAVDIAGWSPVDSGQVPEIIGNLVEKSLIVFVADRTRPRYFFLETIRNYAREKYRVYDTDDRLFQRLVKRIVVDCGRFQDTAVKLKSAEAASFALRFVDDLRYAVQRSFQSPGQGSASTLVLAATPMLIHLGLAFELRTWIDQALLTESSPRNRLALVINLGNALHQSRCDPPTQMDLYGQALRSAHWLGDGPSALQARSGLTIAAYADRRPSKCLELSREFHAAAYELGDVAAVEVARCMIGCALHDMAEYDEARRHLAHVLEAYEASRSVEDAMRYGLNHRVLALCALGSIEFHQGRDDDAKAFFERAIAEAGEHLPSLFVALSHLTCRIAIGRCDWAMARQGIEEMRTRFGHHARWQSWIDTLAAVVEVRANGSREALAWLEANLGDGKWRSLPNRLIWAAVALVRCHSDLGNLRQAFHLADALLDDFKERGSRYLVEEVTDLKKSAESRIWAAGVQRHFGTAPLLENTAGS